MILPDVNVLIYAFRADASFHDTSREWLEAVANDDAQFGLSPLTLSVLARIVTNPRVFREPSGIDEVFAFCDALTARPNCELVSPGPRHWGVFRRLCVDGRLRGPGIADAWFAALAIERGCVWITFDRDYARFPGLVWRSPEA